MDFTVAYTNYMLAFVENTVTDEDRASFVALLSEKEAFVKRNVFSEIIGSFIPAVVDGDMPIGDAVAKIRAEHDALGIADEIAFSTWESFFKVCMDELVSERSCKEIIETLMNSAEGEDDSVRYGTGYAVLDFLVGTSQVVAEKVMAKRAMAMIEGFDESNKPHRYAIIKNLVGTVISGAKGIRAENDK